MYLQRYTYNLTWYSSVLFRVHVRMKIIIYVSNNLNIKVQESHSQQKRYSVKVYFWAAGSLVVSALGQ
jgi:hypothetical protein